jgi:hypothetical protein
LHRHAQAKLAQAAQQLAAVHAAVDQLAARDNP